MFMLTVRAEHHVTKSITFLLIEANAAELTCMLVSPCILLPIRRLPHRLFTGDEESVVDFPGYLVVVIHPLVIGIWEGRHGTGSRAVCVDEPRHPLHVLLDRQRNV